MPLHPDFPVVEGNYQMTEDWSIFLPSKFNRRIENGSLVIWKPGITIWTEVWRNNHSKSKEATLDWIKQGSSAESFGKIVEIEEDVVRYAYRLTEDAEDERQPAFYCFSIGSSGHVQMAIYFDSSDDLLLVERIWRSVTEMLV